MHFSKITFILAPLIGLSAARPPHRPSPSGRITPLPSFSPFPSVSPPPIPSVTLPVPGESSFPGGPFEKREENILLHHHRPHPSGKPHPSGLPHPSGHPKPSSSKLPPPVGSSFPNGPFEKRDLEFHHHHHHRPHPSGYPQPSSSGFPRPPVPSGPHPSGRPQPSSSGLPPPPVGSVFPSGPFEKRDAKSHHHHRPHPSGRPNPSGVPFPSVVPSGFPHPKPTGRVTV